MKNKKYKMENSMFFRKFIQKGKFVVYFQKNIIYEKYVITFLFEMFTQNSVSNLQQ